MDIELFTKDSLRMKWIECKRFLKYEKIGFRKEKDKMIIYFIKNCFTNLEGPAISYYILDRYDLEIHYFENYEELIKAEGIMTNIILSSKWRLIDNISQKQYNKLMANIEISQKSIV